MLFEQTIVHTDSQLSVLRLPIAMLSAERTVPSTELAALVKSRMDEVAVDLEVLHLEISRPVLTSCWKAVPILLDEAGLFSSVTFLASSLAAGQLRRDLIPWAVSNPTEVPKSRLTQIALETQLQDAFKAVEAILGDPPKDSDKFRQRIVEEGLDPGAKHGFAQKSSLIEMLREMNDARDQRAAHGARSKGTYRTITYLEILEFQDLARYIVRRAIEHRLGKLR